MIPILVKCYAGYRGEETPRAVVMGANHIEAKIILDRWLAPEHRYFKFSDPEGAVYIIRHDVYKDFWELISYNGIAPTRTLGRT